MSEGIPHPSDLGHAACGTGKGRKQGGERWFRILTTSENGISPDDRVLEAGCGTGRITVTLTDYLSQNPEGSYEGFDVHTEAVKWCQENITPKYPNFHFQVADIFNTRYNPEGTQDAHEYRFPYTEGSFDFAFLASVFTHLQPMEIQNYISEIGRVLRSGGRCVISYFLLNDISVEAIEDGKVKPAFPHKYSTHRLKRKDIPEAAVAHDEEMVREMYARSGLRILEPIVYGRWAKPNNKTKFRQDIIWAVKE